MPNVDILLPGYSFATDSGLVAFCSVVLVESEGRRILVDTGHGGRRVALAEALQKRDLTPQDVDLVFMTHAHYDHVQNFDLFPNAPMLLHPKERKYAQRPHRNDFGTPQWTGAAIETTRIQEVVEADEIAKGVRVIDLPGHSPGSMGLLVETAEGTAAVGGDALHSGAAVLQGRPRLIFWNEQEARDSLRKVVAAADLFYPGHDRPFRLADGEVNYLTPFQLTLVHLTPDQQGLEFTDPPLSFWIMPGIEEQRL